MWIDARIPVRFGPLHNRQPDEALLTDAGAQGPGIPAIAVAAPDGHPPGCACCLPRSGMAVALGALFRLRATSPGTPFRAVLAVVGPAAEAAVRAALVEDPVVAAPVTLAAS